MSPVHTYGNWDSRNSDKQQPEEPYRKYYFIAEGANTERFYFERLIDERKRLGFKDTIDIRFLEKTEKDKNISYPAHLIAFAENLKKGSEIEFDEQYDKMVVVFDADIFEKKVSNYQELLDMRSGSSIYAVTNPAFELFLLLHLENSYEEIIEPNYAMILKNEKREGKTPIYQLLLEKTGMNVKRNSSIGQLALKIDIAIEQEKKVNQDIANCKGRVTSNIAQIISEIKRE